MEMKGLKDNDDDRCRSLVCDPSGIIVAEMVYRCMICYYITDTMIEAKAHYSLKHMDDEDEKELDGTTESFPESEENNLPLVPQLSGPYYKNYSGDEALSPEDPDNYDPYSPLVTMTEGLEATNGSPNGAGGKSGYVNCAVCGVTRFYSCVQRRYGQFTCVTCYRYFRTFLLKPKKYSCPTLGECLLNVRTRCRACWIKACIDVFSVDLRRQHLVEDYRPVRRATKGSGQTNGSTNGSSLTAEALADLNLGSAASGPSPDGSAGSSSGEIPTISLSFNGNGNENGLDLTSSILEKRQPSYTRKEKASKGVKITAGKKVWSCGKCVTCMAEDCGKCIYCLDRPKFGGPFIKKQRCIKRRCLNKVKNKALANAALNC